MKPTVRLGKKGQLLDTNVFLDEVSRRLFQGRMSSNQKSGTLRLLRAWHDYGNGLDTALAYVLATSYKETGRRMQPVYETFASSRTEGARRLQRAFNKGQLRWVRTPYWNLERGFHWIGAGDVQLTHRANYAGPLRDAVMAEFDVDILTNPDLVMRPDISAFILIEGMLTRATLKGDFTAHALEEYVNQTKTDYANARRVVNPGDRSSYQEIAGFAGDFETALAKGRAAAGFSLIGPESDIYNGRWSEKVENVQRLLREHGYSEVGSVDGRWGTFTSGAVLAFRNDHGLPLEPVIDGDLLAALLGEDADRDIAPARANATVDDLRESGSTDVARNDTIKKIGGVTATVGVVAEVADETGLLTSIGENLDLIETALGWVDRAGEIAAGHSTYVLVGVGVVLIYLAWRGNQNRIAKHRSGEYRSR